MDHEKAPLPRTAQPEGPSLKPLRYARLQEKVADGYCFAVSAITLRLKNTAACAMLILLEKNGRFVFSQTVQSDRI